MEAVVRGHDLPTEKLSVCLPPWTHSRINAICGKEDWAEFLRRILLEALDEIEEPASTQDC